MRDARRSHGVRLQSYIEYNRLIDFSSYVREQCERFARDPVYPPGLYIEQRAVIIAGETKASVSSALEELADRVTSPEPCFLLVLAQAGTGKTFLLRELARRLGEERAPVAPIFVELRVLEKQQKVQALLTAHLVTHGVKILDLPRLEDMIERGKVALLFDGFDELVQRVSYPRAAEHLESLLDVATAGQAKVIITSRTEHFLSDQQVKGALARRADKIPHRQILELCPFGENEIKQFLRRTLPRQQDADRWYVLLDDVKDLLGLAENPRMLSFITRIEETKLLEARKRTGVITAANLYELLMENWLGHEHWRAHPPGSPPTLDATGRWKAVITLAELLWGRQDKSLDLAELAPEVQRDLHALGPEEQDKDVTLHQVGSGTLLVRDAEGRSSFLHRSVLEFAVAWWAAANEGAGREAPHLVREPMSELMADFFTDLLGKERAVHWAQRILDGDGSVAVKGNARLVLNRLHVALNQAGFGGQDLRGQDFSWHSLQGADFSGANLGDATFVGADLRGANFSRANLVGADLSKATLKGADLREADFSSAKLIGADLRGAILAKVCFVDANMVGAKIHEGALEGLDTRGTALPHPSRVSAELRRGMEHEVPLPFGGVDKETGERAFGIDDNQCRSIVFFKDGALFASFDACDTLWDSRTSLIWQNRREKTAGYAAAYLVAADPYKRSLAYLQQGGVYFWTFETAIPTKKSRWRFDLAGEARINAVATHGKQVALGLSGGTIVLWLDDSQRQRKVLSHDVSIIGFWGDSGKIVAATSGGDRIIWDLTTNSIVSFPPETISYAQPLFFSRDGTLVACDDARRAIVVSNIDGSKMRRLETGPCRSVAITEDHRFLGAERPYDTSNESLDRRQGISLWNMADGSCLSRCLIRIPDNNKWAWKGRFDGVACSAFSPDLQVMASGYGDGTLRLWNTRTGALLATLAPRPNGWAAFTPDGRYKGGGEFGDAFVHRVEKHEFVPGELDPYLEKSLRVPDGEPLFAWPEPWPEP